MTTLDLGYDVGDVRNPGGEPPWFPYQLPTDVSHDALHAMTAAELMTALHDASIVATRAGLEDEWPIVDDETYEAIIDLRDCLEREIHRRLLEVDYRAEYHRRLRLGEGGGRAVGGNVS